MIRVIVNRTKYLFCKKYFQDVSREFDEFRVITHICKLRCFSGNVKTVLHSYNYINGPYIRTKWLIVLLQDFVCTIVYDNRCIRIWKLGAGCFPLHQGPITDSLPPLWMAPAVMAVARRADTPARVWRRLPYMNEDMYYYCLPRLFSFFPGFVCFSVYVLEMIFLELLIRRQQKGQV